MSTSDGIRKVAEVIFREDLYPRIDTDPVTVQKYAESIEILPPIEINQHNEIIDGWHRWTAHKKLEIADIKVIVTPTNSDSQLMELAIKRNATHGLQLSQEDKKTICKRIYETTPDKEREAKKRQLATILSIPDRTLRDWLSRIDKDSKEARNKRIFNLWLAYYTQEEIAEKEGCSVQPVKDAISDKTANLPENLKAQANHAVDFEIPIYNIWKQKEKTTTLKHPGNSETRLLDNLLYLYTKPLDVVVDPFGGSGSTIDLCKKRLRRYWVSDRKPIVEREKDIRLHDLVLSGLPPIPRWKDVKLVYLDPPYWKQAEGQYSQDPSDLANMPLPQFNEALSTIIKQFACKLSEAYIALIIQPTQWKSPNKEYTDHIADMIRSVDLPLDMRYSTPYESQQHTAQMVDWAKENKKCLVLTREIVVWRTS
jgi:DNA modification methylase